MNLLGWHLLTKPHRPQEYHWTKITCTLHRAPTAQSKVSFCPHLPLFVLFHLPHPPFPLAITILLSVSICKYNAEIFLKSNETSLNQFLKNSQVTKFSAHFYQQKLGSPTYIFHVLLQAPLRSIANAGVWVCKNTQVAFWGVDFLVSRQLCVFVNQGFSCSERFYSCPPLIHCSSFSYAWPTTVWKY